MGHNKHKGSHRSLKLNTIMAEINNLLPIDTKETMAKTIADELIQICTSGALQILSIHQDSFNKLWVLTENLGIAPQDVLNALGTNAGTLFKLDGELVTFLLGGYGNTPIATMQPSDYTPPFSYTINPDNTVTLK